jgi:hypothetical protein
MFNRGERSERCFCFWTVSHLEFEPQRTQFLCLTAANAVNAVFVLDGQSFRGLSLNDRSFCLFNRGERSEHCSSANAVIY